MKQFKLSIIALFLIIGLVKSQSQPELVIQGQKVFSSYNTQFIQVNGLFFFIADNEEDKGLELWKTDGTPEGTQRVKDIYPGKMNGCGYSNMASLNNYLYFIGIDSIGGNELWKTDGTEEGTVLVKDINVGTNSSSILNLININGTLFFSAYDGIAGIELWKSNGTSESTTMVKDIKPGSGSSDPGYFCDVNGILYFIADNGKNGRELWKSDGTEIGTIMVQDINPGTNSSNIIKISNINNVAYFNATTTTFGSELWKSDGTPDGTVIIKDLNPGQSSSSPNILTEIDGEIYLQVNIGSELQLWKTDGTEMGTVLVYNLGNSAFQFNHIKFQNSLFFVNKDENHGLELWKSDGTEAGTKMFKDIYSGPYSGNPGNFTILNGTLYFSATDETHGTELWKSDGTELGTELFMEFSPGKSSSSPYLLVASGEKLFFYKCIPNGSELWQSNGTQNGTTLLKSSLKGNGTRNAVYLLSMDNSVYWLGTDGIYGLELWKSDSISAKIVKDIFPGNGGSYPTYVVNIGKTLFFSANDGVNGTELWKSNGTEEGTAMIKDIFPGLDNSQPTSLLVNNGLVYFVADDGVHGLELWKTDGTEEGTKMIKDINPGQNPSSPANIKAIGNNIFFSANNGINGTELWKSDGTQEGTTIVKDLNPEAASSSPGNIVQSGSYIFMKASNGLNGFELWKCDTTGSNLEIVKDIFTGVNSGNPSSLTDVKGTLFFTANNGSSGTELWKTDGTNQGTVLVKDIFTGSSSSNPTKLFNVNGNLLFWCNDGIHGNELWKSDGSLNGTVLLKEFFPGNFGYAPITSPKLIDSLLYYPTFDNSNTLLGTIIKSNGSPEGTSVVQGNLPVVPNFIEPAGDYLYYIDNISSVYRFPYKQTIYFDSIPPKTVADTMFTVFARGGSSGNPVIFSSSDTTVAKCLGINGSTIKILNQGTCKIIANQKGNEQLKAAPATERLLVVGKANQSITFDSIPALTYNDTIISFSAKSSSGLPISFLSMDTTVARVFGNYLKIVGAGSTKILAFQEGNQNFHASDTVQQLARISKAKQLIYFDSIPAKSLNDPDFKIIARSSVGLPIFFSNSNNSVATISDSVVHLIGVGSTNICAIQEGNRNYEGATTCRTLTITGIFSLEAEDAKLYRTSILSNQSGFTGTGFVRYQYPKTGYIEWTANLQKAGLYELTIKYSNQNRLRIATLQINGKNLFPNLIFPFSGDSAWRTLSTIVRLNAGANKIKLSSVNGVDLKIDNIALEQNTTNNYRSEIDEFLKDWIVKVIPNPTSDKFITSIPASIGENIRVVLYNLNGNTILDHNLIGNYEGVNQFEINVTSVPTGTYILKVITEKSTKSGIVIIYR